MRYTAVPLGTVPGSAGGRGGGSWWGHVGAGLLCSDLIAVLPLPFLVSLRGGVVFEVRPTELRGRPAGIQNELVGQVRRGGGGTSRVSSGE